MLCGRGIAGGAIAGGLAGGMPTGGLFAVPGAVYGGAKGAIRGGITGLFWAGASCLQTIEYTVPLFIEEDFPAVRQDFKILEQTQFLDMIY